MDIHFYPNFYKKPNSTKIPLAIPPVVLKTLTGNLKEPCSITNPVITINNVASNSSMPVLCTYASIPAFQRFYFVDDWVWNDGQWEVHMSVDLLASFKGYIGNTEAYIERCASESNSYITDTLYPATCEPAVSDVIISAPWTNYTISNGCYVLGVISSASSTTTGSAVTYYALTYQQLTALVDYLLSDNFINDAGFTTVNTEGVSHNTAKALLNPIQYIVSCIWFPKSASEIGESNTRQIKVGYYSIPSAIQGRWIPSTTVQFFAECSIPQHPLASTRGKYLNYFPYTKLSCFLPPFGQFPIDNQYFDETDTLNFVVTADIITGKASLRVRKKYNSQYWNIYETSAMFGVPVQIAQVSNDLIKSTASTLSSIGNVAGTIGVAASGNFATAAGGALMSLSSIGNAIDASLPHVINEGVNGSFSAFVQTAWLTANFQIPIDENEDESGKPLCAIRTIKNLSGFIRCGEVSIDYTGAYLDELEQLKNIMLTGFFWE